MLAGSMVSVGSFDGILYFILNSYSKKLYFNRSNSFPDHLSLIQEFLFSVVKGVSQWWQFNSL